MGGHWKDLEINHWFNYEWNWHSQHYENKYFASYWLGKGVISQLCPQPGWCKRIQLKLSKSCCWMWEYVLGDETPLVRSPLLLGNLINYWITHCREICHNFFRSQSNASLPGTILTCSFNFKIIIIIIVILLHISYNFLHCHWVCHLGNGSFTQHSTFLVYWDSIWTAWLMLRWAPWCE